LVHDWIHVSDVVGAILRALSTDGLEGQVLNVATGRQSTNDDVVAAIERATGRQITHCAEPFPDRPWDAEAWVADVSKTRSLMGWAAAIDLDSGVAQTCEWFKQHALLYPALFAGGARL
jgi:nucleoside-diphosphate-sugar epimerase